MSPDREAGNGAGTTTIETDAVVIGAGPIGLFQVFQLGLQDIRVHVVDSLAEPGGQCTELYPEKPIYDIPGTPLCTGRTLVADLLKQIEPFRAPLHMAQEVSGVARREDGRFDIETSAGTRLSCSVVVVAGGVGSFQPRSLKVPGLQAHLGTQVLYKAPSLHAMAGLHVVVVGGSDAAIETALSLTAPCDTAKPASVTLVHRRDNFTADAATVARLQERRDAGAVRFVAAQPTDIETDGGRLTAVSLLDEHGATISLPLDVLLVRQGLSPRLGPIADWGLRMERKQLVVDTERFETNVPGIFAVGDINTYPGKRKLIVCGFHEATLAAFAASPYVHPERPVQLQYTTTSPRLHRLLGVAPAAEEVPPDSSDIMPTGLR